MLSLICVKSNDRLKNDRSLGNRKSEKKKKKKKNKNNNNNNNNNNNYV